MLYRTFANSLRELGYVVIVPDYQKYPRVKVDGMYKDIRETIKWVYNHANEIRGDPDLIYMLVSTSLYLIVDLMVYKGT